MIQQLQQLLILEEIKETIFEFFSKSNLTLIKSDINKMKDKKLSNLST